MKKNKTDLIKILDSSSLEEIKQMAFAFLRIKEHIWREFENSFSEKRTRETMRLKIAQKHITNWFKEYE